MTRLPRVQIELFPFSAVDPVVVICDWTWGHHEHSCRRSPQLGHQGWNGRREEGKERNVIP